MPGATIAAQGFYGRIAVIWITDFPSGCWLARRRQPRIHAPVLQGAAARPPAASSISDLTTKWLRQGRRGQRLHHVKVARGWQDGEREQRLLLLVVVPVHDREAKPDQQAKSTSQ